MGVMFMYLHYFDVVLHTITVKDAAHSLVLVGHPYSCTSMFFIGISLQTIIASGLFSIFH